MDYSDPDTGRKLRWELDKLCARLGIEYHGVRFRTTGHTLMIEVHLLYPYEIAVGEAHTIATQVEESLPKALGVPAQVITHLEAAEDHHVVHGDEHYTGRPS
jgi:divalent metal cation (Fe/Co/Zn/Cd) transporter